MTAARGRKRSNCAEGKSGQNKLMGGSRKGRKGDSRCGGPKKGSTSEGEKGIKGKGGNIRYRGTKNFTKEGVKKSMESTWFWGKKKGPDRWRHGRAPHDQKGKGELGGGPGTNSQPKKGGVAEKVGISQTTIPWGLKTKSTNKRKLAK